MHRTEEFLSGRYSKDMAICQKTVEELDQRIAQLEASIEEFNNSIRQFTFTYKNEFWLKDPIDLL
jgi:prefoldin subunit 5